MASPLVDTLVSVVGLVVLSLAIVMKVPQIRRIIQTGTSKGINMKSMLMENWCFTILLAYPVAQGYPVRAYMDMIAVNIQNLILLYLVLKDRKQLTVLVTAGIVGYISVLVGAALSWLPSFILYVMSSSVPFIGATGKLLQLVTIVRNKDAGAVSPLTWGIGSMASAGKIFTSTMLTGDRYLIFLSTQAAILNGSICLSALIYRPKPKVE